MQGSAEKAWSGADLALCQVLLSAPWPGIALLKASQELVFSATQSHNMLRWKGLKRIVKSNS